MKSFIWLSVFLTVLGFASACHCYDNDTPFGVPAWGDDEKLGGTSTGWAENEFEKKELPPGCSGKQGSYTCNDVCLPETHTLREYSCKGNQSISYITWTDYEDSEECGHEEVPEFNGAAIGVALIGALGVFALKRKK